MKIALLLRVNIEHLMSEGIFYVLYNLTIVILSTCCILVLPCGILINLIPWIEVYLKRLSQAAWESPAALFSVFSMVGPESWPNSISDMYQNIPPCHFELCHKENLKFSSGGIYSQKYVRLVTFTKLNRTNFLLKFYIYSQFNGYEMHNCE